jgi:hypothetical protein
MRRRAVVGLTGGLFAAGVVVGVVAGRRGIPQEQVPRWLLGAATRRVLRVVRALAALLDDEEPAPR